MNKLMCLYGIKQPAIIIKCKSGVEYYNQVGGLHQAEPSEEGILGIFFEQYEVLDKDLKKIKFMYPYISDKEANEIDKILLKYPCTRSLKVDRERYSDSCEAWIHVDIIPHDVVDIYKELWDRVGGYPVYDFIRFKETKGILIWENSY